ncbi:MAG: T9SS type A sorting domain-containing protein [Bacteroidetes bacterium]|nr:T9SS type A sorting domain-containing protein [Bacteroidota bacterium]
MTKKNLVITILVLFAGLIYLNGGVSNLAQPPAVTSDAPGETSCADSVGCHSLDSVDLGGGDITLAFDKGKNTYFPGKRDTITVTINDFDQVGFPLRGFIATILDSSGAKAGDLKITSSKTVLLTKTVLSNPRQYIAHSFAGPFPDFEFAWDPPSSDIGTVFMYVSGVAANKDNTEDSDHVYTDTFHIKHDTTLVRAPQLYAYSSGITRVYPNPATDHINIDFTLGQQEQVKAEMIDLNGRVVSLLFEDERKAGHHNQYIQLNNRFSPGLYLLRMEIGKSVALQKVFIR